MGKQLMNLALQRAKQIPISGPCFKKKQDKSLYNWVLFRKHLSFLK